MASVKELKKDLSYVVSALVSDTYTYLMLGPDENKEKAEELVIKAFEIQGNLLERIYAAKRGDRKKLPTELKAVRKEMFVQVDEAFDALSSLVKN